MIFPMQYDHLGYDFLQRVDKDRLHSGADLNFGRPEDDFGLSIHSITKGEVIFSKDTGKGWGNLIVIYHSAYGVWSRYAHLNERFIRVGDSVVEGQEIGTCGHTGGNWASHLHLDIIQKELSSWVKYTKNWSIDKVKEHYLDPIKYIKTIQAQEESLPDIVKWHKKHKIIEQWNTPPTFEELKLGWIAYKLGEAIVKDKLNIKDFNLKP